LSALNFYTSLKNCFRRSALTEDQKERLNKDITFSACRAGFEFQRVNDDGLREFHRACDDYTVTVPQQKDLTRSSVYVALCNIDAYL